MKYYEDINKGQICTENYDRSGGKCKWGIYSSERHIGKTGNYIKIYGTDYTVDWLSSGGYWIIYPNDSNHPYAFLYREKNRIDNVETPKPDDLICGVISKTIGTTVLDTAKIGMDHRDFEAAIGQIYVVQIEPESDYILPDAWINLEATGVNNPQKSNYSLMVLEDEEQVVYALLYKQPD